MVGKDKRGQFYLIAAIVIAVALIGITSIFNYSSKSSSTNLDENKEELQIESSYVLDYTSYNSLSDGETNTLLEDFSEDYINTKGGENNVYIIFGKKSSFELVARQTQEESVNIKTSSEESDLNLNKNEIYKNSYTTEDNVTLTLGEDPKSFEMSEGENFYFIISNLNGDEKHVISN